MSEFHGMGQVEEELRRMRREIEALVEALKMRVEPRALRLSQAAQALGVGMTKLKALIRSGELLTVPMGRLRMVPMSEVERLLTPKPLVVRPPRKAPTTWVPIPRQMTRKTR